MAFNEPSVFKQWTYGKAEAYAQAEREELAKQTRLLEEIRDGQRAPAPTAPVSLEGGDLESSATVEFGALVGGALLAAIVLRWVGGLVPGLFDGPGTFDYARSGKLLALGWYPLCIWAVFRVRVWIAALAVLGIGLGILGMLLYGVGRWLLA